LKIPFNLFHLQQNKGGNMKKLLVFISVITILTLGLTRNEIQAGEHPKGDDTKVEHPTGVDAEAEHPKGEDAKAEHPKAEHPKGEDTKAEHPKAEHPKVEQ
jgi:hypothetical protein